MIILITIFLDWQKWSVGEATTVLLVNYVQLIVVILLITISVWSLINLLKHWKTNRPIAILPTIMTIFVISSFTFLPLSKTATKLNCIFNQNYRENIIELLNQGNLQQTDINEYILPCKYRLTSHTGRILVESNILYTNDYDKVLFYIHCGYNISSAVIYSTDDMVQQGDFGRRYLTIYKIKPNWYVVTMSW